ncbi:MAG: GTP cyclohydrolase [Bacteroidota bacterium]
MRRFEYFNKYSLLVSVVMVSLLTACNDDDAGIIVDPPGLRLAKVTLNFTNDSDPNDVVQAVAEDPDGTGAEELIVISSINLTRNTTYTLTYEIENGLESLQDDVVGLILEENDENQLFYSFTDGAFVNPTGDGNIDTASDPINYLDFDRNNNPLGLETSWATGSTPVLGGEFTVRLQHQPGEKTATTGADIGETDFDLTFVLNIQ